MVARAIAPTERSRAVSFIFGGLHVGSLVGLIVAPPLIEAFGWQSVFYWFGALGVLCCGAALRCAGWVSCSGGGDAGTALYWAGLAEVR
jgi:predicted MFS family arabinose efflux permease